MGCGGLGEGDQIGERRGRGGSELGFGDERIGGWTRGRRRVFLESHHLFRGLFAFLDPGF